MRVLLCLLLAFASLSAGAAQLNNLQLVPGAEGETAVFHLNVGVGSHVFTLAHPARVVVDLAGTRLKPALKRASINGGVVRDVRYGEHPHRLRVVLDLKHAVKPNVFTLPAGHGDDARLVINLLRTKSAAVADKHRAQAQTVAAKTSPKQPHARSSATHTTPVVRLRKKEFIVAIDPGHGGKDPGATGPNGLHEKTVTLAVAKKLAPLVDAEPGMKAILTRTGDYYVGLRQRMVIARKAKADLFISIHCNALHHDPGVRGTEVYVLSRHGASSVQARWVANRENAADMVGGIDIKGKTSQLASVLIDISQSATLDASFDLARRLMHSMSRINPLLHPVVQQAAFVVLKSPDIPSALVETGFITNRHEERRLASSRYQEKIAHALLRGIVGYYKHYLPRQVVPLRTAQNGHLEDVSLQRTR